MHKPLYEYDHGARKAYHYLVNYETYFAPLTDREVRILELGIAKGGSLRLWRDYFPKGIIAGLDCRSRHIHDETKRIVTFRGRQEDTEVLSHIANQVAPNGFDIIIDDASHIGKLAQASFWHLFENHLKAGGIYVIEDWRTGYWGRWRDGCAYSPNPTFKVRRRERSRLIPSHQFGMVGFIKALIDELGADMISSPRRSAVGPQRFPKFKKIEIFPGQVFVTKATPEDTRLVARMA